MTTLSYDTATRDFEERYVQLRQKEGRIYADEEVAQLPVVPAKHSHYKEWQVRKQSADRLVHYLKAMQAPLKILEIGCGNGWLTHRLAEIPGSKVTGVDVNRIELEQAKRVFMNTPNLVFICDTIPSAALSYVKFDIVVFAACIQYFPSVPGMLEKVFQSLKHSGEVHVIDSPFYKPGESIAARKRSADYYEAMGLPEMINYYYHHEESYLKGFSYQALYRPSSLGSFFSGLKNPFPWFCIKKL